MQSAWVGLIAFTVIFGGAFAGLVAARRLPKNHLDSDSRNAVSVSAAIVGTLAALVIGLLISTASRSFLDRSDDVTKLASNILRADQVLKRYGPNAEDARAKLRAWAAAKAQELFAVPGAQRLTRDDTLPLLETTQDAILALAPHSPKDEYLRTRALALSSDIYASAGWELFEKGSSDIPIPFLVLLMFWLGLVFASFGLFAPRNATVLAAFLLCSAAVSAGIAMIVDLDSPVSGFVGVSSEPMRQALIQIQE